MRSSKRWIARNNSKDGLLEETAADICARIFSISASIAASAWLFRLCAISVSSRLRISFGSNMVLSYEINSNSLFSEMRLGVRLKCGRRRFGSTSTTVLFAGSRLESISPNVYSRSVSTFGRSCVSSVSLSEFANCKVRRTLSLMSRVASSITRIG